MRLTTQKVSNRPPSMCGTYIKNLSAELFVGRNIISAEQSFGRKIVRPNNYCRKKKIRPTKFLHENRGPGYGSVRFDVYVFGRTIVRPKIISFGRKSYLVRPKIGFSKIWKPDCHESVTHLRDFTHYMVVREWMPSPMNSPSPFWFFFIFPSNEFLANCPMISIMAF
jgi:hypothetical protein